MQCPHCQLMHIPTGEEFCPRCHTPLHEQITPPGTKHPNETQNSSIPSIQANIRVAAMHEGQITGVRVERMGYSAEQVQALITTIKSQFQPKPFTGECPYVGLRNFQESDAGLFFGRESLVNEMLELLSNRRFLVIAGPSGCGKSSIARAGLLQQLKSGALPGSKDWLYTSFTPGSNPLESLGRAIAGLAGNLKPLAELKAVDLEAPDLLTQWLEVLLGEDPSRRAILLVDQFEELFTLLDDQDALILEVFLDQLATAVTNTAGRTTVTITLRSDYVASFAAHPAFNALLNSGFFQIGAMSAEELACAILRPALGSGLQVDPALVTQVITDMRDQPGALPLMQFALTDLFNFQIVQEKGTAINLDGYLARGGLSQALERYADAHYKALDSHQKLLAQNIFRTLVVPGVGHHDSARTASFEELEFKDANPAEIEAVIKVLADARLLTTGEGDGSERTIRLAHERLLEAWPWLKRLVDENRQAIALQQEIHQDAMRWQQNGEDSSYLYRGARLVTAQERLAEQRLSLSGLAERFIKAGLAYKEALELAELEAREAEQRRELQAAVKLAETQRQAANRLRRSAVILGVVLLAAIGFLIWAILAQNQATASLGVSNIRGTQVAEKAATATHALGLSLVRGTQAAEQQARAESAEVTAVYNADQALQQATRARAGELAASSQLAMQNDFSLGLLLALEAINIGDTPFLPAEKALREASLTAGGQFLDCEIEGETVTFSSESRRIFFGGEKGLCVYELGKDDGPVENARLVLRIQEEYNFLYAVSADGRWLVTYVNGEIKLIDLQNDSWQTIGEGYSATALALNSDASWLALCGFKSLLMLNLGTPDGLDGLESLDFLNDHSYGEEIRDLSFSPDGRWLVAVTISRLFLLDTHAADPYTSVRALGTEAGLAYADPIAFSSDGRWLVASGFQHNIWDISSMIWDLETVVRSAPGIDQTIAPFLVLEGQHGDVGARIFNEAGSQLISAGSDRQIHIWDLSTILQADPSEIVHALPPELLFRGHDDSVTSLAIDPSGSWLASSGADFTIRLWDLNSQPTQDGILLSKFSWYPGTVAFSPDGRWLAGVVLNKLVLWDLSRGDLTAGKQTLGIEIPLSCTAWNQDWSWFAAHLRGEGIVYWKFDQNNQMAGLPFPELPYHTLFESPEGECSISASRDGHELLGSFWDAGTNAYINYRWDMTSSDPAASIRIEQAPSTIGSYTEMAPNCTNNPFCVESMNGRWRIESIYFAGQIQIWDLSGTKPELQIYGDPDHPYEIAGSSPDGRWLAYFRPEGVWLWDTTAGDITHSSFRLSERSNNLPTALSFSPDNRWLAIWLEEQIFFLDLSAEDLADAISNLPAIHAPAEVDGISSLSFSQNNRWLLIEQSSHLWLIPIQVLPHTFSKLHLVTDWARGPNRISPDERWLVSVTLGGYLQLFDLATNGQEMGFREYTSGFNSRGYDYLVFSQDGKWLASLDRDGKSIELWELGSSNGVNGPFVLESEIGGIQDIEFHPSGRWLIGDDLNGRLHLWLLSLDDIVERACWAAGRNLTQSEWDLYFPGDTYHKTCARWP